MQFNLSFPMPQTRAGLISLSLIILGCSPSFTPEAREFAQTIEEEITCKNSNEAIWDALRRHIEEQNALPVGQDIEAALVHQLTQKNPKQTALFSQKQAKEISQVVMALTQLVGAAENTNKDYWLQRIAELELGDRTTAEKERDLLTAQAQLNRFAQVLELVRKSEAPSPDCARPPNSNQPPALAPPLLSELNRLLPKPVYGAAKTMAVMYQSCEVLAEKALDRETPQIRGIEITGEHPNGNGFRRRLADRSDFLKSHPYFSNYRSPQSACFDVLTKPSIYDFGGKPFTTSRNELLFDLHRDAGSGTEELGVDCSGFIYAALTSAGLKLKRETQLKASLVHGVSSAMLADPQRNGLSCLDRIEYSETNSIQDGDLVALPGHVFMVESTGPDPFGIAAFSRIEQCAPENIKSAQFDFVIIQSSPSKGGIGINRIRADEYLRSNRSIEVGLIDHAVHACRARFGERHRAHFRSVAVVRHLMTPECTESQPIEFSKTSCLNSCSAQRLPARWVDSGPNSLPF